MAAWRNLKINHRLRIHTIFSIVSLVVLGFASNYFYNTGRTLSIIINAERVQNNTFQSGYEDFIQHEYTSEEHLYEQAISKIETANQMAYHFGIINQILELKKEEAVDKLYELYQESYNYDRENAYLMVSRIRLLMLFGPQKLEEAQQIAMQGYILGEKIKSDIQTLHADPSAQKRTTLNEDLNKMRLFYSDFASAITHLIKYTNRLLFIAISILVLLLISTIALASFFISKSITMPIREMVNKFGIISTGNLNAEIHIQTKNEFGELANSFREIQNGIREVIRNTQKVADGDYNMTISPRSKEDEMSIALNKMVLKLKEANDKNEQDSWFKSSINLLNEKLSGNHQPQEISNSALSLTMELTHSILGSIHTYQAEYEVLIRLSSIGFEHEKLKNQIRINEGLPGQAAASRKMVILDEIPEESYTTFSSAGKFSPKQIILVPLVFNDKLIGVLELCSLTSFTTLEIKFIRSAAEIIAINLHSAESILRTNELLQKTQDQASELQVQQEELRVANEELLEHTKILTENEKRLQVQQEELRVANEELEERTRQLEIQKEDIVLKNNELSEIHKALEKKAQELQTSSHYKSEFLANMSHELRTPLNSLLILSNILAKNQKGNLTSDQMQSASIIHKSGTDLLNLINEILDLSKIEAGKMTIQMAPIKTNDIKEEILQGFNPLAQDKKLSFNIDLEDRFPTQIVSDRLRLMQIIRNLLSNAFKFTTQGGVSVRFSLPVNGVKLHHAHLRRENAYCISVSDSGVGIAKEKQDAIFEAFQQADGSISRKFGGTGLGLSISKELIRLLGGEIQLESTLGIGSTFYLYLPLKINQKFDEEETEIQAATEISLEDEKEEVPQQIIKTEVPVFIDDDRNKPNSDRTVLIIHPVKEQAIKLLSQVREKNFDAIVACDIESGLILAEKYRPKAIMLTNEQAKTNTEGYQKLKEHRSTSKLPIHMISIMDHHSSQDQNEIKTVEATEPDSTLELFKNQADSSMKKLLIIEDDLATRRIIHDTLSVLNIETHDAQSAGEAYKILSTEKFDCIILDLGLPDFSGKELLEKLSSNHIAIPKVIVYTGREMSKEDVKDLSYYTDTIILKGIKSDERLTDEVALFLHQVSKRIPVNGKNKTQLHDTDLFKGKKILIVDDDIRNIFSLGQLLEEREIEVHEAENGQVAIDVLKSNSDIDLVLMDVMMPVMDGYEAMRIIRKTNAIKDIPIICLTAKAMKEDHENALKNGANDYLSKPLNEDKLFSMLKIWLYKN